MTKPPLIETPHKAISVVADESSRENKEQWERFAKAVAKITKGSVEKTFVLTIVLQELLKLKRGQYVGFDFGTSKEFEIIPTCNTFHFYSFFILKRI